MFDALMMMLEALVRMNRMFSEFVKWFGVFVEQWDLSGLG